jgi:peptidoglycan DL-endopeptidase CwlO
MSGFPMLIAGAAAVVTVAFAGVAAAVASPPPPERLPACTTAGPIPGLDRTQAQNARVIASVADARLGDPAPVIAVMTALTESGLRVLANPNDPAGTRYPNQGVGYDHDSLGLFQQRPSWGGAAARMDPVASTNLFLDALQNVADWRSRPPWQVAQAVQRSAFDGTPSSANGGSSMYGGNYLAHQTLALSIVATIEADAGQLDCGAADIPRLETSGTDGRQGLPESYRIPTATSPQARIAVTFALAQLGKPYLWGGTGPERYDCSGLTQAAWRAAGYQLGRTTWQQALDGSQATIATLRPGDLVLIPGSDGSLAAPSHMGLYLGNELVIHAPKSGDVVRVTDLAAFVSAGLSGIRHIR